MIIVSSTDIKMDKVEYNNTVDRNNKADMDMSYTDMGNSMDKAYSIPAAQRGSHTLIGFSCYRHSLP